jgi:hypothetical protein
MKHRRKKQKQAAYEIIPRTGDGGRIRQPYKILEEMVKANHNHLTDAKIILAWRYGWKSDADGRLKLGQCKKASELDRKLHDHDFVILLNHEAWNTAGFTEAQMKALIDHELCHAEVTHDRNGEPKVDADGRTMYRIRRHDCEEFREIVARHGLWKQDLEAFAETAMKAKDGLFAVGAA